MRAWAHCSFGHRATCEPSRFNRQREVLPLPIPVWTPQRARDALQRTSPLKFRMQSGNALAKLKRDFGEDPWLSLCIANVTLGATGCSSARLTSERLRTDVTRLNALDPDRQRALSFCGPEPSCAKLPVPDRGQPRRRCRNWCTLWYRDICDYRCWHNWPHAGACVCYPCAMRHWPMAVTATFGTAHCTSSVAQCALGAPSAKYVGRRPITRVYQTVSRRKCETLSRRRWPASRTSCPGICDASPR